MKSTSTIIRWWLNSAYLKLHKELDGDFKTMNVNQRKTTIRSKTLLRRQVTILISINSLSILLPFTIWIYKQRLSWASPSAPKSDFQYVPLKLVKAKSYLLDSMQEQQISISRFLIRLQLKILNYSKSATPRHNL